MARRRNGKKRNRINWERIDWGSLTKWCQRHNSQVEKHTGKNCFTKDGKLNDRTLRYLYNHPEILAKITRKWRHIWRKIHFKLHVLDKRRT